jgi:MFS family permease
VAKTFRIEQRAFFTYIPARMDRLPWGSFHWLILCALGITWILDGLEVTMTGTISGVLHDPQTLHFTSPQIGALGSAYVAGAVLGSLGFGYATDRWGRKQLVFITLMTYLLGVFLTAFSWNLWSFMIFRFLTGAGIGGEYAAINSTIDEIIPARLRGRVDLAVNGTYWIGAAIGSISTLWLLDPRIFPVNIGWRIGFGAGAVIGLGILFLRSAVPESPRWLVLRGRREEAEKIVSKIEDQLEEKLGETLPSATRSMAVHPHTSVGIKKILRAMFTTYKYRTVLGLALMTSQAFLFNAIFFTYALVLTEFYNVPGYKTGLYLLPFAVGNFLGPVLLGPLFDTVGRKKMIAATYGISGFLLVIAGFLFLRGQLTAQTQTLLWSCIFFFASTAASAAYLTVSEIFPLETRGLAIAIFYSIGTGIGGIVAPWLFGSLIGTGSRFAIFIGYGIAAALMIGASVVEIFLGVAGEGKSLEEIAQPLSAETPPSQHPTGV